MGAWERKKKQLSMLRINAMRYHAGAWEREKETRKLIHRACEIPIKNPAQKAGFFIGLHCKNALTILLITYRTCHHRNLSGAISSFGSLNAELYRLSRLNRAIPISIRCAVGIATGDISIP